MFPTVCALALPLSDLRASISLVMLAGFEVWYALTDIHEESGRNQKRRDCERTVLRCPATRLSVIKGNHFAIVMILVSEDLLVPRQSLAFLCAKLFGCF